MGDIGSHAQIGRFVADQVRRGAPSAHLEDSDFAWFALGNFLTDASQFWDPPAFHQSRDAVTAQVRAENRWAGWAGLDRWAVELFGAAGGDTPVMGRYVQDLVRAVTHLVFDEDAPLRVMPRGPEVALWYPIGPLPAMAVATAMAARLTQYFPHEHLDFPAGPIEDLADTGLLSPDEGGRLAYLGRDLRYLSEELSRLEFDWVLAREAGTLTQRRKEFLLQLGHLCHPIEDFFFHANLMELYQWQAAVSELPERADPPDPPRRAVIDQAAGARDPRDAVRLRRRLQRRLRLPAWAGGLGPVVYTGGFGASDMAHSVGSIVEAVEALFRPGNSEPSLEEPVLLRLLTSAAARRQAAENPAAMRAEHLGQLRNGSYARALQAWQAAGLVCSHAADRIGAAIDLDRRFSTRRFGLFPGPGAALITLLAEVQRERDRNAEATAALDERPESAYDGSPTEASAETIGSHSLLAKDSATSAPLRTEAMAFAQQVSAGLALILVRRVHGEEPSTRGIDWDRVLSEALPGVPAPRPWAQALFDHIRSGGEQPVVDPPTPVLIDEAAPDGRLARRRRGGTTAALEAEYRAQESKPTRAER